MKKFLALALFSVSFALCAQDTTRYSVLSAGKTSGQQWIVQNAPNSYTLFYEFNDRGNARVLNRYAEKRRPIQENRCLSKN